jgi:hypothetical protein
LLDLVLKYRQLGHLLPLFACVVWKVQRVPQMTQGTLTPTHTSATASDLGVDKGTRGG